MLQKFSKKFLVLFLVLGLLTTTSTPGIFANVQVTESLAAQTNHQDPITKNQLPPFPEDATRPPTDWSQVNWEQEISLPHEVRAYQAEHARLLAEDRVAEAKALPEPVRKFSTDEVLEHYHVPLAVQELVRAYRAEQEAPTVIKTLWNFFQPTPETSKSERQAKLAADIKATLQRMNYYPTDPAAEPAAEKPVSALAPPENILDLSTAQPLTGFNLQAGEPITPDAIQIQIPAAATDPGTAAAFRKKITLQQPAAADSFSLLSTTDSTSLMEYYDGIENHPIENLLYYLSYNQNSDGSFGDFNQYELTSQIALILDEYNQTESDQFIQMLTYLKDYTPQNNREKAIQARFMLGLGGSYQDLLDELLAQQNLDDGGFPFLPNYQSDLLTTLEVLWAFWAADQIDNNVLTGGLAYVFSQIQADGSLSYFADGEPSYYLINQTLAYLQPFADLSIGTSATETVTVQSQIDLLLNFLEVNYDSDTQTLTNTESITDELMTLVSFQLYDFATEKQELLFEKALQQQNFNGSFGDSLYATIAAMQALAQPDLNLTNLVALSDLANRATIEIEFTMANQGYAATTDMYLFNFFDNFQINTGADLAGFGLSLEPQAEINVSLNLSPTTTQYLIGETEIKFYLEAKNDFDTTNNWLAENFTFASDAASEPALPTYYIAAKYESSGSPALNIRWPEKTDTNRSSYIVLVRELSEEDWNFISVSNDWNGTFLSGFSEGVTYEITAGVLGNGSTTVYYFDEITQIQMSADEDLYTGSVTGYATENQEPLNDVYTTGYSVSETTDSAGNFTYENLGHGSSAAWIEEDQYEPLITKFAIPNGGTTENVRLFTRLKPDTEQPTIESFYVLYYENSSTFKNQYTWQLQVSATDNVKVKEADFYYYDPGEDWWLYLGTASGSNGNFLFDWYIPADLVGSDYKIRALVWDYQGNSSAAAEWGPFEILDGTEPSGTVEVQGLTEQAWALGESKMLTWEVESANSLAEITSVYLYYGSSSLKIASDLDPTQTSLTYTMPLDGKYIAEEAYIRIYPCDTNDNCAEILSETFAIRDNTASPQAPWGTPQEMGLALEGSNYLYREITNIFQNTDGSLEIIYKETEGYSGYGYSWDEDNTDEGNARRIIYRKLINGEWQDPLVLKEHIYFTFYDQKTDDINFWNLKALKDLNNDIHVIYDYKNSSNSDSNDEQLYYLKVTEGTKVTDLELRNNSASCINDANLAVNDAGQVFLNWLEGYDCENYTGTNTLWYLEGDGNSNWTSATELTSERVYNHALAIQDNQPVLIYRTKLETAEETTYPLILSTLENGNWSKITLWENMADYFWEPQFFDQNDTTYTAFYISRSEATDWQDQLYFLQASADFTANTGTVVENQELLDLTTEDNIKEFTVLPNADQNYHVFYRKDLAGANIIYHLFLENTETYFHTWISSLVTDSWELIALEDNDFLTAYFVGNFAEEALLRNTADYSQIIDYRLQAVTPVNKAVTTASSTELEWQVTGGAAIESYAIFLGVGPVGLTQIATDITATNFTVTDLLPETTYYWQVIGQAGDNLIPSNVWQFTTGADSSSAGELIEVWEGEEVVIPLDDLVLEGDEIVYTIDSELFTEENGNYIWETQVGDAGDCESVDLAFGLLSSSTPNPGFSGGNSQAAELMTLQDSCTPNAGFEWCYDYYYSYNGCAVDPEVHGKYLDQTSRSCTVNGQSASCYIGDVTTQVDFEGDELCLVRDFADWDEFDQKANIGDSGCSNDINAGTVVLNTAPAQIENYGFAAYERNDCGSTWVWAWSGGGYTPNWTDQYAVLCLDDSDCTSGQICDLTGDWQNWYCKDDPCLSLTCSDYCSGDNRYYSGQCESSTGSCTYQVETCAFGCNSGVCNADPCAGITCTDYCAGSVNYAGGQCSNGSCQYQTETCTFGCDTNTNLCADDPCLNSTCNDYCGGDTRYYSGQCNSGTGNCEYQLETCDYGCESGVCNADPCLNLTCDDYCSGDTRYSSGQCSGGECSYTSEICEFGCESGICNADPCAGVTCENYCSDDTIYTNGTCVSGACSYQETFCEFGCEDDFLVCQAEACFQEYTFHITASNGTESVFKDVIVRVNSLAEKAPKLQIFEPDGLDDTADTSYTITWTDQDIDYAATIALYYDTDNTGENGTLIVENISEDDETDSYTWDTTEIPENTYYIYGIIENGSDAAVAVYSSGTVTLEHSCTPPTSGDWVITQNCTLEDLTHTGNLIIQQDTLLTGTLDILEGNVTLENNAVFTVAPNASLVIDLYNYFLKVLSGSGLLIQSGGKVAQTE